MWWRSLAVCLLFAAPVSASDVYDAGTCTARWMDLLEHDEPEVRRVAVMALKAWGPLAPTHDSRLVERVYDDDPHVRILAAGALSEMGATWARRDLEALETELDPRKPLPPPQGPLELEIVEVPEDPTRPLVAAEVTLIVVARGPMYDGEHPEWRYVSRLLGRLGELEDPELELARLEAELRLPDEEVRSDAFRELIQLLERWSTFVGPSTRLEERVVSLCVQTLEDPSAEVRKIATHALGFLGTRVAGTADHLERALEVETQDDLRELMAESLQLVRGERVEARFHGFCGSGQYYRSPPVGPAAVDVLTAALADPCPENRLIAVGMLRRANEETSARVLEALRLGLLDSEPAIRSKAAETLGSFGEASRPAVPVLLQALEGNDLAVQVAVLERIPYISREPEVIEALLALLEHSNPQVRSHAAAGLGVIGASGRDVIAGLAARLGDEDSDVRWRASRSLGEIAEKAPEAMRPLREALHDADTDIKHPAASSIISASMGATLGPELKDELSQALAELAQEPDPYLSEWALEELRRVSERD